MHGKSNRKRWDVFVCHATEDKESVVQPLVDELERLGVRVWYDSKILRIGDSLKRRIEGGLKESRYGVVVLSPEFFRKQWPQRELDALTQLNTKILPVWHNVSHDEVAEYSPMLADIVSASTKEGPRKLAFRLFAVAKSRSAQVIKQKWAARSEIRAANETEERIKLLVIDDDPKCAWILREGLEEEFEVFEAKNGVQGIRLAKQLNPPLILLDFKMPGLDGIAVLKRLRKLGLPSEIVMMSGYGDTQIVVSAMKLGAADFMNKPFDVREVGLHLWNVYRTAFLREYVRSI